MSELCEISCFLISGFLDRSIYGVEIDGGFAHSYTHEFQVGLAVPGLTGEKGTELCIRPSGCPDSPRFGSFEMRSPQVKIRGSRLPLAEWSMYAALGKFAPLGAESNTTCGLAQALASLPFYISVTSVNGSSLIGHKQPEFFLSIIARISEIWVNRCLWEPMMR